MTNCRIVSKGEACLKSWKSGKHGTVEWASFAGEGICAAAFC